MGFLMCITKVSLQPDRVIEARKCPIYIWLLISPFLPVIDNWLTAISAHFGHHSVREWLVAYLAFEPMMIYRWFNLWGQDIYSKKYIWRMRATWTRVIAPVMTLYMALFQVKLQDFLLSLPELFMMLVCKCTCTYHIIIFYHYSMIVSNSNRTGELFAISVNGFIHEKNTHINDLT